MARKPVTDPHRAWNIEHFRRLAKYDKRIEKLLNDAIGQAALLVNRYDGRATSSTPFTFSQNRKLQADIDKLMKDLSNEIAALTKEYEKKEWETAYKQATEYIGNLYKVVQQTSRMQDLFLDMTLSAKARNLDALAAFQKRKIGGLGLSSKVWNYTKDFEQQMEVAIDTALMTGRSAENLSRDIRSLLIDPDALFRRVRGMDDQLRMSKAMQSYEAGPGRYRSAYKNAMRLARSEINMAYRSSDSDTAQMLDCVVGIRINLSNNHTCNGEPFVDICDELTGDYPKDFHFTGWHTQCRCFITYINKTEEEFWRDLEDGVNRESVNTVKDVPENFKKWVAENQERIDRAEQKGTLPYFIRDNEKYVKGSLDIELEKLLKPTFTYTPYSSKLTVEENVNNLLNAAEGAFGRKKIEIYRKYLENLPYNHSFVWKHIKDKYNIDDKAVFESLNHLNELSGADLSAIPARWRDTFNELAKKINKHDVSKGYFGVYSEIEHAYNIYKLSTNKDAIAYGLDKLSDKTPYVLFTEFRTKIEGYPIPKKEFFDEFDKFVPLFTGRSKGAYFDPTKKHVYVGLSNKDTRARLETSEWFREGLMYHEYGHALDDAKGFTKSSSEIVKIYDDWKSEILKDNGKALEKAINDILTPKKVEFKHWWLNSEEKRMTDEAIANSHGYDELMKAVKAQNDLYDKLYKENMYDIEEQLGALSDCLGAAIESSRVINPRYHEKKYFIFKENQLAEFLAHTSENYWKGNPYFEQLAPDLYKAMVEYFKGVM